MDNITTQAKKEPTKLLLTSQGSLNPFLPAPLFIRIACEEMSEQGNGSNSTGSTTAESQSSPSWWASLQGDMPMCPDNTGCPPGGSKALEAPRCVTKESGKESHDADNVPTARTLSPSSSTQSDSGKGHKGRKSEKLRRSKVRALRRRIIWISIWVAIPLSVLFAVLVFLKRPRSQDDEIEAANNATLMDTGSSSPMVRDYHHHIRLYKFSQPKWLGAMYPC